MKVVIAAYVQLMCMCAASQYVRARLLPMVLFLPGPHNPRAVKSPSIRQFVYLFIPGILILHVLYLPRHAAGQGWTPHSSLAVEAAWTVDAMANMHGGKRQGTSLLHSADLLATVQPARITGWPSWWPGLSLYGHGLRLDGEGPTRLVGDLQGTSNIEARSGWELYELWAEQLLMHNRLSVVAGKYGVDSEFDVIHTATVFVNSSHGTGPDFAQGGTRGPSIFPEALWGARLRMAASPSVVIQTAVLDADNGNILTIAALSWMAGGAESKPSRRRLVSRTTSIPLTSRIAIGAWNWSGNGASNRGVWVLGERRIPGQENVSIFARTGIADRPTNRITAYTGGGVVLRGPFEHRPGDTMGLAVAVAHEGSRHRESNIEASYRAHVVPQLDLQAHVQFVANPDASSRIPHALVAGLRILASL